MAFTVVEPLPPLPPPESLEELLNDKLASLMLIRFAESEHSVENVLFLLEVHELNMLLKLKARLRRMLTRRSSARRCDMRRSDTRRSDIRRNSERDLRRGSTAGGGLTAHTSRAIELTRAIIKRHVATNNLCLTENIGGALRKWLHTDEKRAVPNDLIDAAYAMTLRTVKYDIFPRFRRSSHFDQLLCVHLGRTLQHGAFREAFEVELTPMQSSALAFWRSARDFEQRHSRDTLDTIEIEAQILLDRHRDLLSTVCPDEFDALRQALDAESTSLESGAFAGCIAACQNQLVDPYVDFVSSEKSTRLLKELGVGNIDLSSRPSSAATRDSVATVEDGEEDWAAGW